MIKNVLTIDLDIILENKFRLYEDLSVEGDREAVWQTIYEKFPELETCEFYNRTIVSRLKSFLKDVLELNPNAKFQFGLHHDGILRMLEPEFGSLTDFNIINIDNHHDICYSKSHIPELVAGSTNSKKLKESPIL